jgi:hypothetical protein
MYNYLKNKRFLSWHSRCIVVRKTARNPVERADTERRTSMAIYIEHDYYPMDVYSEPERADHRDPLLTGQQRDAYAQVQWAEETYQRNAA